jgi:hypothetical protein
MEGDMPPSHPKARSTRSRTRRPFLEGLLARLDATLSAAAFAEEDEAATARQLLSGRSARRRR